MKNISTNQLEEVSGGNPLKFLALLLMAIVPGSAGGNSKKSNDRKNEPENHARHDFGSFSF